MACQGCSSHTCRRRAPSPLLSPLLQDLLDDLRRVEDENVHGCCYCHGAELGVMLARQEAKDAGDRPDGTRDCLLQSSSSHIAVHTARVVV